MNRYYFVTDDLGALQDAVRELKRSGLDANRIHVLSHDDAGVANHADVTPVEAVLKKDVVRGTEIGAVIGIVGAAAMLGLAYAMGLTTAVGWVPFLFLAVVVLGFCTWEGGLFGIQEPHQDFKRFEADLDAGKHVFFVDVDSDQEAALARIVSDHPRLQQAGEGRGMVRGSRMASVPTDGAEAGRRPG